MSALTTTTTTPTSQPPRTCDQLGICQGRTIPCLNCTRISQDEGDDWSPDDVTSCTPFEAMWYWVVVAFVVLAVLTVIFAVPSYLLWGMPWA